MAEHDYRRTYWGHNVEFIRWIKRDKTMRLAIWGPTMRPKDTLLLTRAGGGDLRVRILKVEQCRDPRDMAFLDVRIVAPQNGDPK